MARTRKKKDMPSSELPMTPMIDVVFQLLIYFIVTIRPVDVYAIVDVTRPSPDKAPPPPKPIQLLKIGIFEDGYTMNERPISDRDFPRMVETVAKMDKEQTVLILATPTSTHDRLVRVLDLCAKNELKNLSVLSAN